MSSSGHKEELNLLNRPGSSMPESCRPTAQTGSLKKNFYNQCIDKATHNSLQTAVTVLY